MTLLGRIVPADVVVAEAFGDPPAAVVLSEEAELVRSAVPRRRREFATGRHCARLALAELGLPPAPVLRDGRAPVWPDGVVGSITHCDGYRAAAVARSELVATVGIDAEPHEPLPDGVARLVTLPKERDRIGEIARSEPGTHWDRVWYSAKESVYKAWSPLAHGWLDFSDVIVDVDADGGFVALLSKPLPLGDGRSAGELPGTWLARDGLVLTAVVLLPPPPRRSRS